MNVCFCKMVVAVPVVVWEAEWSAAGSQDIGVGVNRGGEWGWVCQHSSYCSSDYLIADVTTGHLLKPHLPPVNPSAG